MERKDEEDFQLSFMADITSPNCQSSSQNQRFVNINDSYFSSSSSYCSNCSFNQNPNSDFSSSSSYCSNCSFNQNPNSDFSSSSSYCSNCSFHQNPNSYFHPHVFVNSSSSQTYPLTQIPNLPQSYESIEGAFRRINLNMPHSNPMFIGNRESARLHRMRVESGMRGQQIGLYINEDFLGAQFNSTGAAMAPSANFPSTPRSRPFDELAYTSHRHPAVNNIDLHQLQSRLGNNSTWDFNVLESQNPNSNLLSSMYNHPQGRSCKELKGFVCSIAKDQNGCRLLQKQFDNELISHEVVDMILSEVKNDLHELMVHQFANHLIHKTFKASNQQQKTELLLALVTREQRFLEVCLDTQGTRAVQKIMEQITSQEHRSILLTVLRRIVVTLTKNIHGNHIIQRCFNKFSDEDTKHIVDEIANHILEIATDKSGCCVLQQCLVHAKAEARGRILTEIIGNSFILSEDRYGNYVVQYVPQMGFPYFTSNLIMQLQGSYVTLSTNKFGSNVVEKCLQYSEQNYFSIIVKEIMFHPDFVKVLQDAYGNYVVQSALKFSKGDLHNTLVRSIVSHHQALHSHLYGKMVLDRIKCSKNRV